MDHRIGSSAEALCDSIKAAALCWSMQSAQLVHVSQGTGLRANDWEKILTPFRVIGPGRWRRVRA